MKTYRIEASSVEYLYADIEAETEDEAWDIAYKTDGGDFKRYSGGDWQIDSVTEKEVKHENND
jgi:hypothetical protein